MAFENKIKYEVINPTSNSDSNYEDFEYLLQWYGRKGQFYQRMFTDWEITYNVDNEIINIQNSDEIKNIPQSEDRSRKLIAEDITINDLEEMTSIFVAKEVKRVFKDGTTINVGILPGSVKYKKSGSRFDLEINIVEHERPLNT